LAHNTGAPLRNEVVFNKVVMKMSVIRLIMTIAIIAVSIVMTVVILMQEGRSQGLGAISGAAETYWGKNKGRSMEGFLEKFTTGLVIAFFVLAIFLNMQLF
jgi:preprotein translocase subunit SecG